MEPRLGAKNENYYKGYNPHPSHCCATHGCKYGYDDCPVWLKEEEQEYPCESCDWDNRKWHPIKTEADLPKEHGEYWVTTKVVADPFSNKPRTIKFKFDDSYKARFWMGSFRAWMEIPPAPPPYYEYSDFWKEEEDEDL